MSPARDDELDTHVLAAHGGTAERSYSLASLPRIRALGAGPDSGISVQLRFGQVDGRVALRGALRGRIDLPCQRCLAWVGIPIDERLDLVLVDTEAAMAEIAEPADAVLADASRLDLAWLAEEEALLALPLVPMHEAAEERCVRRQAQPVSRADGAGKPERQKPFANLRDLLDKS